MHPDQDQNKVENTQAGEQPHITVGSITTQTAPAQQIDTPNSNVRLRFLHNLKRPMTFVKIALVILACITGSVIGIAINHHRYSKEQSGSDQSCSQYCPTCDQNCTQLLPTISSTDNNSHDIKTEEDISTIDNAITTYLSNVYNNYYGSNGTTGALNQTVNVNHLGIKGLNYSLSSYQIGDMQTGTGTEGQGVMYTICAKFDETSSNFSADMDDTNNDFTVHPSGRYCFAVDDGDGPDSGITGYYPGQPPNFE